MTEGQAKVITPLGFTDEELLTIQNGVVLEMKRTAAAGQILGIEHALALFHRLQAPVSAAVERLKKQEQTTGTEPGE